MHKIQIKTFLSALLHGSICFTKNFFGKFNFLNAIYFDVRCLSQVHLTNTTYAPGETPLLQICRVAVSLVTCHHRPSWRNCYWMYSRDLQDATLLLSANREKIALMTRLCFPRMKNVKTFKFLWHFLIIFWHINPDFAFLLGLLFNSKQYFMPMSAIFNFLWWTILEAFDSAFSLVIVANVVFF